MKKKAILFSVFSLCSFVILTEVFAMGPGRRGGGRGRGRGRNCQDCQYTNDCERGSGRGQGRRDGTGPRAQRGECPLQDGDRDQQGRRLKRDGTGPCQDGRGPRGTNLGPREDCPKK